MHGYSRKVKWCMMNSQNLLWPPDDTTQNGEEPGDTKNTRENVSRASDTSDSPPTLKTRLSKGLTPFWHDRIVEAELILSMAPYYQVAITNLLTNRLFLLHRFF